jgi:hypothetical protein
VHVTVVCPTENADPAGGVQLVVIGGCPFTTVGAVKVTVVAPPSSDCAVCATGHVIFGRSAAGGTECGTWVGVAGPAHAARTIAFTARPAEKTQNLRTNPH